MPDWYYDVFDAYGDEAFDGRTDNDFDLEYEEYKYFKHLEEQSYKIEDDDYMMSIERDLDNNDLDDIF
ncbi:hypothetical protein VZG28_04930 [Synechococcus elongatus IITB4]|uniref:hypothetical protein n=1 Tax=Synechococcus elongatus TaxID=32046 RepID=UPI0030D47735